MTTNNDNLSKLESIVGYLVNKINWWKWIDEIKLHKLLYFCDFDFYETYEFELSWSRYIRNTYWPTNCELITVKKKISYWFIKTISIVESENSRIKYLPWEDQDINLKSQELTIIDNVIEKYGNLNVTQIVNLSHEDIPRKFTGDKETIPLESVFYRTPEFSVNK